MAQETRKISQNRAEDKTGRHRVLSGNRGSEFRPISFLIGTLVVAAIIAMVYFAGGLGNPNTVLEINP
jgi:hypothetical protein